MARRGGRSNTSGYVRRSAISPVIASSAATPFNIPFAPRLSLVPVEDLRRYHPLGPARSVKVTSGHAVGPVVVGNKPRIRGRYIMENTSSGVSRWLGASSAKTSHYGKLPSQLAFAVPGKTIVCVRRKRRREVLFAKRKAHGAGRRRRNQWSNIACR